MATIEVDLELLWKVGGIVSVVATGAWTAMGAKIGRVRKSVEKLSSATDLKFKDVDQELETERKLAATRSGNLHRRLDDLQRDLHTQQAQTRDELKQDIALVLTALGMRRDP